MNQGAVEGDKLDPLRQRRSEAGAQLGRGPLGQGPNGAGLIEAKKMSPLRPGPIYAANKLSPLRQGTIMTGKFSLLRQGPTEPGAH